MVVKIDSYDGIEANQISGVIDSEDELRIVGQALGIPQKMFRDSDDRLKLAVTEQLYGRLFSVQFGVGSWIWLRPLKHDSDSNLRKFSGTKDAEDDGGDRS